MELEIKVSENVDRNGIQRSHLTEQQELTDQSMFELLENSSTTSQISLFNSLEAIGGTEAKDVKSTKDYIEFDSNVIDNSQENKLSAIESIFNLSELVLLCSTAKFPCQS